MSTQTPSPGQDHLHGGSEGHARAGTGDRETDRGPAAADRSRRSAPGAKRARHQRWRRIAKAATVLALIAFLAAGVLFVRSLSRDQKAEATRDLLGQLGQALKDHRTREGALPDRLAALSLRSSDDEISREDGWGRPIEYRVVLDDTVTGFRLRSSGTDGTPGTDDDLVWPPGSAW